MLEVRATGWASKGSRVQPSGVERQVLVGSPSLAKVPLPWKKPAAQPVKARAALRTRRARRRREVNAGPPGWTAESAADLRVALTAA